MDSKTILMLEILALVVLLIWLIPKPVKNEKGEIEWK